MVTTLCAMKALSSSLAEIIHPFVCLSSMRMPQSFPLKFTDHFEWNDANLYCQSASQGANPAVWLNTCEQCVTGSLFSFLHWSLRMRVTVIFVFYLTANTDYLTIEVPFLFSINSTNRGCVDITILQDSVTQNKYYEVFLVRLINPSVPVFADQVVVVILDQG